VIRRQAVRHDFCGRPEGEFNPPAGAFQVSGITGQSHGLIPDIIAAQEEAVRLANQLNEHEVTIPVVVGVGPNGLIIVYMTGGIADMLEQAHNQSAWANQGPLFQFKAWLAALRFIMTAYPQLQSELGYLVPLGAQYQSINLRIGDLFGH
jgi:hypothetical protein